MLIRLFPGPMMPQALSAASAQRLGPGIWLARVTPLPNEANKRAIGRSPTYTDEQVRCGCEGHSARAEDIPDIRGLPRKDNF